MTDLLSQSCGAASKHRKTARNTSMQCGLRVSTLKASFEIYKRGDADIWQLAVMEKSRLLEIKGAPVALSLGQHLTTLIIYTLSLPVIIFKSEIKCLT